MIIHLVSPERKQSLVLETWLLFKRQNTKAQEMAKTLAQLLSNDQWMSTQIQLIVF